MNDHVAIINCNTSCFNNRHGPAHRCHRNFDMSLPLGGMESAGLLEMMHRLWDKCFLCLFEIVTNNDSKMKARCRWSNDVAQPLAMDVVSLAVWQRVARAHSLSVHKAQRRPSLLQPTQLQQ